MGFWLNIAAQRSPQLVHLKFLTSEEGRNTTANWDRLSHIRRHYSIKFKGHCAVYLVIFVQVIWQEGSPDVTEGTPATPNRLSEHQPTSLAEPRAQIIVRASFEPMGSLHIAESRISQENSDFLSKHHDDFPTGRSTPSTREIDSDWDERADERLIPQRLHLRSVSPGWATSPNFIRECSIVTTAIFTKVPQAGDARISTVWNLHRGGQGSWFDRAFSLSRRGTLNLPGYILKLRRKRAPANDFSSNVPRLQVKLSQRSAIARLTAIHSDGSDSPRTMAGHSYIDNNDTTGSASDQGSSLPNASTRAQFR
ncbi:uncharacterized protein STEHIDRAFT_112669 [Stereum hirsutum FP-91666 SS1]|uniref:uncharacterized protein n=1 Tax=Stereum hirsutum (strain FP-91666) TaxID=721885 RepID=UPI0004449507|nr:uncharacterized protein STEHIDRAFT_112669 [Stereum hirsutum FP-91666 SS1]EIM84233.1 hypothetical protein STEHIDRAFT_112669 [Stereum hirsutum FP-91666 SS1]